MRSGLQGGLEMMRLSSLLKARAWPGREMPGKGLPMGWPVSTSQMRKAQSCEPVTIIFPSWLKAMHVTSLLCHAKDWPTCWWVSTSQMRTVLESFSAAATLFPSGLTATSPNSPSSTLSIGSPICWQVWRFQMRRVPSSEPVTTIFPLGKYAATVMGAVCPFSSRLTRLPVFTSQKRTFMLFTPVMNCFPSGLKDTSEIFSGQRCKTNFLNRPLVTLYKITSLDLSRDVKTVFPSGLMAMGVRYQYSYGASCPTLSPVSMSQTLK